MIYNLKNAPGVRRKTIDAVFISKASELNKKLTKEVACTSAGDNGAINIWFDDKGKIRCHAYRFCNLIDEQIYEDLNPAVLWAKKWLIKIK